MEFCAIFRSIQTEALNPTELANKFIAAKQPLDDVNLQLTQLLMCLVGIKEKIDENLVINGQIDDIHEFVNRKTKDLDESEIPLSDNKFLQTCLAFFQQIFVLDWSTFVGGLHFDAYFIKLLEELSECEPTTMHVLCFSIRLKVVTAYLRGAGVNDGFMYMTEVKRYAKILTDKAIFYKSIQCVTAACTELYEWIKINDSFATDKNLRLFVWSAKMEQQKLVCHALLISYSILRMNNLREKIKLFVLSLVKVFEDLCYTKINKVFDCICSCCELVYTYHKEAIQPWFLHNLLDNLFAEDRVRAESAARFWIYSFFDPNCHRKNIRMITRLLEDKDVDLWKILVDSIIDVYPIMVDFEALVGIMLDDDESVLEEDKLTMAEKERLLSLMSYTIEELVTGQSPTGRSENRKTLTLVESQAHAGRVTETMMPRFWDMYDLPFINAERARITLIYTATFFNFQFVNRQSMVSFIDRCFRMFTESRQPHCYKVALDVLVLIRDTVKERDMNILVNKKFKVMTEWCEVRLNETVDGLINHPDKYANWESEDCKMAEADAIRVVAVNRVVKLSRQCLFVNPHRMFEFVKKPRGRIFIDVLFVCVDLISEYALFVATWLKTVYDEPKYKLKYKVSELDKYLTEVEYVVKTLPIKLQEWYTWRNLSNSAFVNLCEVLEEVKTLPCIDENKWNVLLPQDARFMITGYVAARVWNSQDDAEPGMKTYMLKIYLRLITKRILPLSQAYDVMTFLYKQRDVMEAPLREFIKDLCLTVDADTVVDWLLNWMKCIFRMSPEIGLKVVDEFVLLVLPIRKEMQNVIFECVRNGIKFAVGDIKVTESEDRASSTPQFLDILLVLSECLEDKRKRAIEKIFKDATFKSDDVKAMKNFLKCLRKRPPPRKSVKRSLIPEQEPKQSAIPFSPSSITQSSSVFADESDVESWGSSDLSWFITRSPDGYRSRHSFNVMLSEMMKENAKKVERAQLQYDYVKDFIDSLPMETASETTKGEASSVSIGIDDIANKLSNVAIGDTSFSTESLVISSQKSESPFPQIQVGSTPSTSHDNATNLEDTTPVGDFNAASTSSSILSKDDKPRGKFGTSRVITIAISPPSQESSPAKSDAKRYRRGSTIPPTKKKRFDFPTVGDSPTATPEQHVTGVPTYDQLVEDLMYLNTENSSSALVSSGEDDAMKAALNESISSTDTLVFSPRFYTPYASPISPQTKPTDTRAETMSQVYESVAKLVNVLEGEKSSASAFSDDDDLLKRMSNVSVSGTSGLAQQTAKKLSHSSQTKQADTQPVAGTSQTYDSLAEYINRLKGKDSSASETNVSKAYESVVKFLNRLEGKDSWASEMSFGEADLHETYVSNPTSGSIEDITDSVNILASGGDEQPDSFGEVGDGARNVQGVSLSKDETGASDLPTVSGLPPPIKKRRQHDH